MRLRKTVRVAIRFVDREPLGALHTLQLHETAQRHTRRSRRETEHFRPLFPRERLERTPEPYDNRVGARVAVVLRRRPPLIDVDVGGTRDEELEFALVELGVSRQKRC